MKTIMEKWEKYLQEGRLVGNGMGKALLRDLESLATTVQLFDPDSETSPLSGEIRAEILLQFERLQEAIQKFEPTGSNNETPI